MIWYVQVQYYTLGLSLKFNPHLVISRKFRYRAPKTRAFTTRALLSRNYNVRENSLQLPNPDTRNPPSDPEPKGALVQIGGGYFCNTPYILDKRVPKSWFLSPIASFPPFEISGRHNLSAPAAKPHPPSSATSLLPSRSLFPDDVVHRNSSTSLIHLPG